MTGRAHQYGRVFGQWRREAGSLWPAYAGHAFVAGLADGSLPRGAYLRYLRQDYIFLVHFARAWALAVTKAETVDEMRMAAQTVAALLDDEMQLHVATCAAEGISEADLRAEEEADATLAYTRFVLDAGHAGDFLDLMAALAPCVLGYAEIGARLGADPAAAGGRYGDWIATYAGRDYQELAAVTGAMIDAAAARRLGPAPEASPRWPGLCRTFATATRLEAAFWQMGLDGP